MDLRRVRASDWAAGIFGAALIGLLWAPWYRGPRRLDAWQSMAVDDVIFLIAGLLGIWVVVATFSHSTGAVPLSADVFASLAGIVASVLAVVRLIWPPDLGPGPTDRAVGVWLGTAAVLAMTLAALASMHSERRGEGEDVPVKRVPAPSGGTA